MIVSAGALDRSIALLTRSTARDAAGQPLDTWTASTPIAAGFYPLRDSEVRAQAGRADKSESKFLIRYRAGVTTLQRLSYAAQTYEITGTQEIGRRAGLWIFVREIAV